MHANFEWNDEGSFWSIEDLLSTNGTSINKEKIPSSTKCPLAADDIISLGTIDFQFTYIAPVEQHTTQYSQSSRPTETVLHSSPRPGPSTSIPHRPPPPTKRDLKLHQQQKHQAWRKSSGARECICGNCRNVTSSMGEHCRFKCPFYEDKHQLSLHDYAFEIYHDPIYIDDSPQKLIEDIEVAVRRINIDPHSRNPQIADKDIYSYINYIIGFSSLQKKFDAMRAVARAADKQMKSGERHLVRCEHIIGNMTASENVLVDSYGKLGYSGQTSFEGTLEDFESDPMILRRIHEHNYEYSLYLLLKFVPRRTLLWLISVDPKDMLDNHGNDTWEDYSSFLKRSGTASLFYKRGFVCRNKLTSLIIESCLILILGLKDVLNENFGFPKEN